MDDETTHPPSLEGSASAEPSNSTDVDITDPSLGKEIVRTQDRQLSRKEWTRRALIIGFFALFLVLFGFPAYAALLTEEPFNNVLKVVNVFAPLVTAIGGYIAGHYFPGQNPSQNTGGDQGK